MRKQATPPHKRRWWLRLASFSRHHWPGLTVLLLLMGAEAALAALRPWPMKLIVDHVLINTSFPPRFAWLTRLPGVEAGGQISSGALLVWLASLTIMVMLLSQAVSAVSSQVSLVTSQRMVRTLRMQLFDHMQRLSLQFHARRAIGDLIHRVMSDTKCVQSLVLNVVLSRVASTVRAAIMVAVLWRLDRTLTLIVLAAGPPLAIISRLFSRGMTTRTLAEQQLNAEMTSLAEQTLSVLPVVQGFGREDVGDERFASLTKRTLQANIRLMMSQMQFQFGTGAVRSSCVALVILVGGLHALQGSLSVGSLLLFLAYLESLLGPIEGLAYASVGLASAAAGAQRVFEILDAEDIVRDTPGAQPLPAIAKGEGAHIRVEGVVFGYEPGRPVLHGVSMEARPGELVALVGATGAGKSTMVSLVPRFFDPWEGRVTVNGVDVRGVQLKSLRDQVALVLQEAFILPLSIADNIAYGRPDATREEIEAVAHAANAHDFIERLPQGYDTIVGERGATLSGGERQRLAIARAFLRDAPILILDEPTSSLDVGTESLVLGALERLMEGRTVLVIAHRLSTVRRADRIVVIDDGRIVEEGTHDELIAIGGKYEEFYQMQYVAPPTPVSA